MAFANIILLVIVFSIGVIFGIFINSLTSISKIRDLEVLVYTLQRYIADMDNATRQS